MLLRRIGGFTRVSGMLLCQISQMSGLLVRKLPSRKLRLSQSFDYVQVQRTPNSIKISNEHLPLCILRAQLRS